MPELRSEFLFELRIELEGSHIVGQTPMGLRRMDYFTGGHVKGPRVNGVILPGGSDVLTGRADGAMLPDVRLTVETDDGALIYVNYRGIRCGPEDVMARIAAGEEVPPDSYYLRNAPFYETADERYAWLNEILSVGVGRRLPGAAVYDVFRIL